MSDVHFYHDAADPLAAAAHFAVKAWRAGRKVAIATADPQLAARLDQNLWTFESLAFVPHVAAHSPLAGETPVLIGPPGGPWAHQDVLINLEAALPPDVDQFAMVVEIVGQAESAREPARTRWRQYRAAGHTLTAHGLGARG